jgi:hypothetical protein
VVKLVYIFLKAHDVTIRRQYLLLVDDAVAIPELVVHKLIIVMSDQVAVYVPDAPGPFEIMVVDTTLDALWFGAEAPLGHVELVVLQHFVVEQVHHGADGGFGFDF